MYSMYLCTVNKTDRAILKIANEITKIQRNCKEIIVFSTKIKFFSSKSFFIFGGPSKGFLKSGLLQKELHLLSGFL